MKEFPKCFKTNADSHTLVSQRLKEYMRVFVYEHVLSHDEKEYFSLDEFSKKIAETTGLAKPKEDVLRKVANDIVEELKILGWKTSFCFGGTGLFIYRNEKPANCWADSETLS